MLRSRPSELERRFWRLADYAVRHNYATCRQIAILCRLQPSRKSPYWRTHLSNLKSFISWRDQQDDADTADREP